MRKYGRAVAEIEVEAVVVGMPNRTLMPVLSVSRNRPPDKAPPGTKERLNKGWREENGHRKFVGVRRDR